MNKKLVFSWGHILAALACIALSYAAFVGLCYYTGGNFLLSGLIVAFIDTLLIISFIGAQQFKIWEGDFHKNIIIERWLLFIFAPLALVIAMTPVNHFLLLRDNQDKIVSQFTCATDTAKMIFNDFETYANDRIMAINKTYTTRKATDAEAKLERFNARRALKLQLLGHNYDTIRNTAIDWIDNTVGTPSIYNIMVLGNLNEINKAFMNWNQQLSKFSSFRLSHESKSTSDFGLDNPRIIKSINILENLKTLYRSPHGIARNTIPVALILGFLLLIPWLIQRRNTKSTYRLLGKKKASRDGFLGWGKKPKKDKGHGWVYDNDDDGEKRKSDHVIKI